MKCCNKCFFCEPNTSGNSDRYMCTCIHNACMVGPFTFNNSHWNGFVCKYYIDKSTQSERPKWNESRFTIPRDGQVDPRTELNADTKEIMRIITSIEKHPGLFMPEGRSFTALNRILYGTIIGRMNTQWYEIYMEITNEFQKKGTSHLEDVTQRTYYEWDLNDEEMFDLWFECFYKIIEKYKECKE